MSRRKVILPSWAVSSETSKDIVALNERFPDLSKGELIINTKEENVTLTTLDEAGKVSNFISEDKIDEKIASLSTSFNDEIKLKQDVIEDLEDIRNNATIGVSAFSNAKKWVEEQKYATETFVSEKLLLKQDAIDDLEDIRSGAALGSTALQAVPDTYAKKTDIPSLEGYATEAFVSANISSLIKLKQNVIEDLDDIRSGASLGATALQEVPAEYATESFVTNAIAEAKLSGNTEIDLSGYVSEDELKEALNGYAKNGDIPTVPTKVSELENDSKFITIDDVPKVDAPTKTSDLVNDSGFITIGDVPSVEIPENVLTEDDLEGYATTQWVEDKKYLTEHQNISGKQDVIEDLDAIRSGAALGATALREVPAEYAKKSDLGISEPITLKGGVWADVIRSVFGDTIPTGITFEDFLRRMAFAELWPEDIETLTNLYIEIKNSTVSLSGITNNSSVEVGTEVFLTGITPSKIFDVHGIIEITGMDYGYIDPYTGKYTEGTSLTLTGETNVISTTGVTNNILNVNISGFTDGSGNKIENISTTSMVNDIKMYVNDGTNKIVTSQKSRNYEISSTNEDIEIRYMSNMKDINTSKKYTTKIEYKSGNTEDKKTFTIYSYRNTFYGITDTTASETECNSDFIRSLTATNRSISSGEMISFTVGSDTGKRMTIASPRMIKQVRNDSLNQDVTAQLKEKEVEIMVYGANGVLPIKYYVYDNEWNIEFTEGHKWEITFE